MTRTPQEAYDEALTYPLTSVYRTNLLLEALVLAHLAPKTTTRKKTTTPKENA